MPYFETELTLTPDLKGVDDPIVLGIEIELAIDTHPTPESGRWGPPEYYDPGDSAEWSFVCCRIIFPPYKEFGEMKPTAPLEMGWRQFESFFGPAGDLLWEQAQEHASDNYDPSDYE